MDLEDEAMPYFKLLNENSGNYLLQNSYELQDCLSVEPMFTEIETESWPSECFPVLLNDSEGSNIYQKDITSSSNISDNLKLSQESVLRVNSRIVNDSEETQQRKQKRTLLMFPNGNTYQLNYSNKFLNTVQLHVEEKLSDVEDSNQSSADITNKTFRVSSPFDEEEGQENYDLSDWNEFYSIVSFLKCKVCSFLCESSVDMADHLRRLHCELLQLKRLAEKEDANCVPKVKMKSLLDSNSSAENNVTIFLCSMCNNIFSSKELLMEHVKIHNQDPNPVGVTYDSVNNETTHLQNEKPKPSMRNFALSLLRKQQKVMSKIKCSVKGCTLKFSSEESKLRHEACHVPSTKHYQCPECKENFSIWRVCSKHLWTCHKIDIGLYTCTICNKYKSNSRVAVMNHMDIHNSEKPFVCTECFKGFKQLNQLRNHKLIHKRDEKLPPWSTTSCLICERFFANKKSLKNHVQSVHEKIKPFACEICGHKTSRKSMLDLHMRQHTGDKPHHCLYCTYRTADQNCLKKHMMKHSGLKKYSCPYCKYKAIQSSAYKNHLVTKHPEATEIFNCHHCSFSSLRFESYLTHIKCHEYDEANCKKRSNSTLDISISKTNDVKKKEKDDTQAYLHLPEEDDYFEEIDDEGISISGGREIQLTQ